MTTATITGYHAGYVVAAGVDTVDVASNGTVGGAGMSDSNSLTLNNDGLIAAVGYTHGVTLDANAVITNHGTMTGWDTIYEIGSGTVVHLTNYGLISSNSGEAVVLDESSGSVENAFGAMITGHYGIGLGSGLVGNLGTISVYGQAAGIGNAGTLTNGSSSNTTALIEGRVAASVGTGTITNYARIIGGDAGALVHQGSVVNGSKYDRTALIQGATNAIEIIDAGSSVTNFATILSLGKLGVYLWAGTTLTNGTAGDTTASISGVTAIRDGGALTATNYGVISGWGGDGISLSAGGNITNGSSTDKTASISGYAGIVSTGTKTTYLTNFGSIVATLDAGVSLGGGGQLLNGTGGDTHALISGAGGVVMGATGFVQNFATIDGNSGAGVGLNAGGGLINGGGVDTSALIEGYGGVSATGAAASVTNFGTILGTGALGHYGVYISVAGGTLINGSVNNSTALIAGYGGVDLGVGAKGINFGTLRGAGNIGGAGALLVSGAALVNGAAGKPGALIDGYEGVVTYGGAATFTNFGTVIGENGTAVLLSAKTDVLVIEPGARFIGSVNGGGGTLALGAGTGTISGLFVGGNVTVSGPVPTTTFHNFGKVAIDSGASFTLAGTGGVVAGQSLILGGTLAGTGTLALAGGTATFGTGANLAIAKVTEAAGSTASFTTNLNVMDVWTQTGGTVTVAAGDRINFLASGDSFAGTLAGAGVIAFTGGTDALTGTTLSGSTMLVSGGAVTLSGAINLTKTLTVTSPNLTIAAAGATLSGGGILYLNTATSAVIGASAAATLTNKEIIEGAGQLGDGQLTIVNAAGGIIAGFLTTGLTINTGAGSLSNAGLIENTNTGGTTITGAVSNTGTLLVSKGTLTVDGAVTAAGIVKIGGGTADFGSTFTENVTFTGTTGVLELSHSQTYTGQVTGLSTSAGGSTLDLLDIAFASGTTKATFSGTTASGTLTVTDGTHTAKITLMGNYLGHSFITASDGHGGTTVADPANSGTGHVTPLTPLITAISTFGERGGELAAVPRSALRPDFAALVSPA